MPAALLEEFQSLLTSDRNICQTLRGILIRLPPSNYNVLSYLCHHLAKIAAHSDKTKMTVTNLALVFAPTLAIGHILFQALLGAFHEGTDTSETKEVGLQNVWGEPPQAYAKGEIDELTSEDQEQHLVLHRHSIAVSERRELGNSIATLPPVPHRGASALDLTNRPRNRQTVAGPVSTLVLSDDNLREPGVSEDVRLMNAMLQREGSDLVAPSTLDSESLAMNVESEERKLMDAMLQREATELVSTSTLSSEGSEGAAENEESRLMYDMLQREEMAIKSGLGSPRPGAPSAIIVVPASIASSPIPLGHLTSTAIIAATSAPKIAELGLTSPFPGTSTLSQGDDMSNIKIEVKIEVTSIPSTPPTNSSNVLKTFATSDAMDAETRTDSSLNLQEPLPEKNVPGALSSFEVVSVSV